MLAAVNATTAFAADPPDAAHYVIAIVVDVYTGVTNGCLSHRPSPRPRQPGLRLKPAGSNVMDTSCLHDRAMVCA